MTSFSEALNVSLDELRKSIHGLSKQVDSMTYGPPHGSLMVPLKKDEDSAVADAWVALSPDRDRVWVKGVATPSWVVMERTQALRMLAVLQQELVLDAMADLESGS